jgi:hypothetical protein
MYIEEALYSYLSTYSGLVSLIAKKIYPIIAPEGTVVPYVTYTRISGQRYHAFRSDSGMTNPIFQFSCFGTSYGNAKAIAAQLRAALQNYSNTMGGVGGVSVQSVLLMDENDLYDEEAKEYYTTIDFQFFFNE